MARGEFSIIVANLGITAGLSPNLTPFTALYVLILAIVGPLRAKESKNIYTFLNKFFKWSKDKEKRKIEVP
jgi:CPA2 family monovalent cation:H+ antiporter-2